MYLSKDFINESASSTSSVLMPLNVGGLIATDAASVTATATIGDGGG
jgi:hypothetical protein